jgi:hypothetical protein
MWWSHPPPEIGRSEGTAVQRTNGSSRIALHPARAPQTAQGAAGVTSAQWSSSQVLLGWVHSPTGCTYCFMAAPRPGADQAGRTPL